MSNQDYSELSLDRSKIILLSMMPLSFKGLVFETTRICNANCDICYQSAGPIKPFEQDGHETVPVDLLVETIKEASGIETLGRRFHIAGGEAFIFMDDCIRLFETARTSGFLDLTGTTNAFWAKDDDRAKQVCRRLRKAGVTSLEISWDFWHKKHISPASIENCLKACRAVDIETNLRLLTSPRHSISEALSYLNEGAVEYPITITSSPVFPSGRALTKLDKDEFFLFNEDLYKGCHSCLSLTVNPFGYVSPCCAGFDQTNYAAFGNIRTDSIVNIVSSMGQDPLIRALIFNGIGFLIDILRELGIEYNNESAHMCSVCRELFSQQTYIELLEQHFFNAQERGFQKAIDYLEGIQKATNLK